MNERVFRQIFFIGIAAYIVLFILSLLFFKERTVLLDASYALFHMLRENSFSIEFHRFPDAIVQFLPLMASRLDWQLIDIMKIYSAGFVLFYFVCYLITGLILKRYDFAIVILLVNILFVTDTFYYTPSQLPQGTCFMMLFFAFLSIKKEVFEVNILKNLFSVLFIFLFVILLAFFHPLIIFTFAYSVIFFILRKEIIHGRTAFYCLVGTFIAVLLFKSIALRSEYETHSLGGLRNFITKFPGYIQLYSNQQFFRACFTKFAWIPVIFVSIVAFYFKKKELKKLLFFIGYFLAYFFLINISYPDKNTPGFYIENLYLPLGLFLALPFVFDLLPVLIIKKIALPAMALIIFTGCIRIYTNHTVYSARVNWEGRTMHLYEGKKVILDAKEGPMDTLMMLWGTPYEFWLLSTSEGNPTASILIDEDPEKQGWIMQQKKSLFVYWFLYPYTEFPKNKYFRFTDTTTGYVIIH